MRESERDSAQMALAAAQSGVEDASALLDAANAELRRIEGEIRSEHGTSRETAELIDLESGAYDARDTVAACQVALQEAQRVVSEYEQELEQLNRVVRSLQTSDSHGN